MATTIHEVIRDPHPDVELGLPRKELHYYITSPDKVINADTGLIMSISGYVDTADSAYQREKLRPYLADEYNCVVVGVNYHGIDRTQISLSTLNTDRFCEIYGYSPSIFKDKNGKEIPISDKLMAMYTALSQKNIRHLDRMCVPCFLPVEYSSFGFLPAIDNLQVLGHVLKKYEVNPKKIIAFGSSYGGYIALLMGKYAPNTFSVIIDNSGFSRAKIAEMLPHELAMRLYTFSGLRIGETELAIEGTLDYPWTMVDETSPYYLSDSHRSIRSLLEEGHLVPSETRYFIFHSIQDTVAPISEKDKVVDILRRFNRVHYKKVSPSDIDGKLFKNMEHGMEASLRELFNFSAEQDTGDLAKTKAYTDFSLESVNAFHCGNRKYTFAFTKDNDLQVKIDKVTFQSSINHYAPEEKKL